MRSESASTLEVDVLRQVADDERILADLRKQMDDIERFFTKNPR